MNKYPDSYLLDALDRHALNLSPTISGYGAVAPDGRDFWGKDIRACLNSAVSALECDKENTFQGFSKGEKVMISPPCTPQIISYGGAREGFPANTVGKTGLISSFDRKTLSLKTVCITIDGQSYWGNHSEIKKVNDNA